MEKRKERKETLCSPLQLSSSLCTCNQKILMIFTKIIFIGKWLVWTAKCMQLYHKVFPLPKLILHLSSRQGVRIRGRREDAITWLGCRSTSTNVITACRKRGRIGTGDAKLWDDFFPGKRREVSQIRWLRMWWGVKTYIHTYNLYIHTYLYI